MIATISNAAQSALMACLQLCSLAERGCDDTLTGNLQEQHPHEVR